MIIANTLASAKSIIASENASYPSLQAARHVRSVMKQLVDVVQTLTATETDFIELPKDYVFTPEQAEARKRWAIEFVGKFTGAARGLGYGVFQGGTMVRDIDLVAVPWTQPSGKDLEPVEFVLELCRALNLQMGNHGTTLYGHQWYALWDLAHRDHQIDLKVILPAAG